ASQGRGTRPAADGPTGRGPRNGANAQPSKRVQRASHRRPPSCVEQRQGPRLAEERSERGAGQSSTAADHGADPDTGCPVPRDLRRPRVPSSAAMAATDQLLAQALARDPGRPLLTYYDDATGERAELSATTLANWVAKTANLLQDELALSPGDRVA